MPTNITSLEALRPHVDAGAVFKYSMDGGETWKYVKIIHGEVQLFSDSSRGYDAVAEVTERGAHALTDRGFERGMIVRPTLPSEVAGKRWSYDH